MKISKLFLSAILLVISGAALTWPQTFPPVTVTGPFPKGTEDVRHDSPVDSTRTSSPMIYHEYTCYKVMNPPAIDGNIENDSVWAKIPWTLMTFWESQFTERTFTVFSNDTSETWHGPKDCTAWFKLLWDDAKVYVAVKVFDDIMSPVLDTSDLTTIDSKIYLHDCIQLSFNTTPPDTHVGSPIETYLQCELGAAIATVYPPDTLKDTLDTMLLIIVPDTTKVPDTSEAFTFWQNGVSISGMSLAPGANTRGNGSTKNKAIHISVEKTADYCITTYEFALQITDTTAGFLWSPYIHDDKVGRFSIMTMDHDSKGGDSLEAVCWASGILNKDFNKFGSIKWSVKTPDGIDLPTSIKKQPQSFAALVGIPRISNSSAGISYTIAQNDKVQLSVYNLLGKKIATLVDRKQAPGTYHVRYASSQLPKGAYFYHLKMNTSDLTKKLLLVK